MSLIRRRTPEQSTPTGEHEDVRPRRPLSRPVLFAAGALALLGVGTYGWSLANGHGSPAAARPAVLAASGKCLISYSVFADDGQRFKAQISVANRGTAALDDWNLWFLMPGDQVVSGKKISERDGAVAVKAGETLAPQDVATIQVSGRYRESNSPPMVFKLNGQTCNTFVSSKPGEPARPVEHLGDSTARLGPAASTPVPGLSTAPNGAVVPVPTTSGSQPVSSKPASSRPPSSRPTGVPPGHPGKDSDDGSDGDSDGDSGGGPPDDLPHPHDDDDPDGDPTGTADPRHSLPGADLPHGPASAEAAGTDKL